MIVSRRRGRAQLIGLRIVVGVAVVVLAPAIVRRILVTGGNRSAFFDIAVRLFSEQPLVGVGPGIWAVSRLPYTPSTGVDEYVPHAHDLYLQGISEMGLVGLIAGSSRFSVCCGSFGMDCVTPILRDGDGPSWRRSHAPTSSLTSWWTSSPTRLRHSSHSRSRSRSWTRLARAVPDCYLERAFGLQGRLGGIALGLATARAHGGARGRGSRAHPRGCCRQGERGGLGCSSSAG